MSGEVDKTLSADEPNRAPDNDRSGWLDVVLWCGDIIVWAVIGMARLAAWVFVGILTSCS
jgi:hypothetical protein